MARPLLIYGGTGLSQEADVSMHSGENFHQALTGAGIEADAFILNADNKDALPEILQSYGLAIPILHGSFGEDGQIQQVLERHKIKYLGSDSTVSKLCFNKLACKERLTQNNILVPNGRLIHSVENLQGIALPAFAKPNQQGSGLGITRIDTLDEQTKAKISQLLKDFGELLVEEFIDGIEISVGILADEALPVAEIIPPNQELFTYENRYSGITQELIPPVNISPELQDRAQQIALATHRACGCRHLSRVDMIVRGEEIFVLEINTLPGMTAHSLYPKEAMAAGYTMSTLASKLVELAQRD